MMVIVGIDAVAKAYRTGEAILERTRRIFRNSGLPDYSATRVEVIGAESLYGRHSRAQQSREVMMRVAVNHPVKQALEIFAREIAPAGTSWAPGTTGPAITRPTPSPLIKQFAFALPKRDVSIRTVMDGLSTVVEVPVTGGYRPEPAGPEQTCRPLTVAADWVRVPLVKLAWGRSGDKGNISNIGIIARKPEYLPLILDQLTCAAVKDYFSHLVSGRVERYMVPGLNALNFLLYEALDGGGTASLRMDPLGKGMAQMLLDVPIAVPPELSTTLS
jgi:hypothetical protein